MAIYSVTIPFAGHLLVTVEASSESEAKEKAFDVDVDMRGISHEAEVGTFELLDRFNQGNVCFCPQPWEVEVEADPDSWEEEE